MTDSEFMLAEQDVLALFTAADLEDTLESLKSPAYNVEDWLHTKKIVGNRVSGYRVVRAEMHDSDRFVVQQEHVHGVFLSTVFLHISASDECFETMVFGGKFDCYEDRYKTLEEAEAGHEAVKAMLLAEQPFGLRAFMAYVAKRVRTEFAYAIKELSSIWHVSKTS